MILNNKTIDMSRTTGPASSDRESTVVESSIPTALPHVSYEVDVLSQFRANMNQLEDLQRRLKFVMHEVSSLIVKK